MSKVALCVKGVKSCAVLKHLTHVVVLLALLLTHLPHVSKVELSSIISATFETLDT